MDYGGGYSTTSYGAQGGAGGGGFMTGSQGGSQGGGAGKGTYGKDTLRPVTIKQIIEASIPHPDAEAKIDDVELTFVGQIRNISTQTTNITYKLDDGTGTVEVKQWIDADAASDLSDPTSPSKPKLEVNEWARVWGRLKAFNDRRHVGAHVIRPVENKMDISYHMLEATYVHLYFARGGPEQFTNPGGQTQAAGGQGMQDGGHEGGGDMGMNGRVMPNVSANARKVYSVLKNSPQSNEGLHVQNIAASLGLPVPEVMKAGDDLLQHSLIFTTVDDNTWAILEF